MNATIKRALPPAGIVVLVAMAGGVTGEGILRLDEHPISAGSAAVVTPRAHRAPVRIEPGALRLEGQVIDRDEHPIGGATVMLGARATTTEADGSFAFDDLAAARYRVSAEKGPLYGEESARLDDTSEPIVIRIELAPAVVLHVRDRDGAPIVGATAETSSRSSVTDDAGDAVLRGIDVGYEFVTVGAPHRATSRLLIETDDPGAIIERTVTLDGGAAIEGVVVGPDGPVAEASVDLEIAGAVLHESATTDAAGRWRVDNVGAGRQVVSATANRYLATPDQIVETDGAHAKTGVVVRVAAGGEISGVVVDGAGHPVADARVSAMHIFESTDATGRFTALGLEAGTYDLSATSDTGASPEVSVELAPRGRVTEVRLVLARSSIAGIVVDPRGEPIDGARVVAESKDGNRSISVHADERGRFDVGGVLPGDYKLTAERARSKHDAPPPVAVTAGDRRVRLVVPDAATLTGRVVFDGKPITFFGFVATPTPEPGSGRPIGVRATNGRFTERNLPPGLWGVVIVAPGFLPRMVSAVPIAAGATADLGDIALDRGRSVRGRVVDERGRPIAGATVTVSITKSVYAFGTLRAIEEGSLMAHTDADGRYAIEGIAPAQTPLRIEASAPDGGISIDRALGAGETSADLVIVRSGGIDGSIADMEPRQPYAVATSVADDGAVYNADIDGAGTFRFEQLPPGNYIVRVVGRNAIAPKRVSVTAGARTPLAFAMARDGDQ